MQNRNNNYRKNNNHFSQQRYNNNTFSRNSYNNNDNNRQWNPGQYKNFNSRQFQNYCEKPGHLVRDCKIRPDSQSQTAHQENSKALPSTGALRKA